MVIIIANLCPNMFYFDALDFSECRSEEVFLFDAQCIICTLPSSVQLTEALVTVIHPPPFPLSIPTRWYHRCMDIYLQFLEE